MSCVISKLFHNDSKLIELIVFKFCTHLLLFQYVFNVYFIKIVNESKTTFFLLFIVLVFCCFHIYFCNRFSLRIVDLIFLNAVLIYYVTIY